MNDVIPNKRHRPSQLSHPSGTYKLFLVGMGW